MGSVRFNVLGPLEAARDGTRLHLGGPRPRAVLATLLLANGRHIRTDALIDSVWGESQPDTAVKTVQKYISFLRQRFGDAGLIVSRADGYELHPADLDVRRFEAQIDEAIAEPSAQRRAARLSEALTLWRGEPYGDLPNNAAAQAERRRLTERRLSAFEALAEARLALGQSGPLIGWLEELIGENPLRERLWGMLMRALYRSGRQAEALAAFQRLRAVLVDELGVEPTPDLRELHQRILRQEEAATTVEHADHRSTRTRTGGRRGTLPHRMTSFVGRDAELGQVRAALTTNRLVTLTGPAGSGKTRLAVEFAGSHQPDDGAWFVELAGLVDDSRIPSAVASVLRLGEQPDRSLADVLADYVADKGLLLILDNCEHVLDSVAQLASGLLAAGPAMRVLATSRQPLGVEGEITLEVPPLSVPATDNPEDVVASDAVRLMIQRAQAADPHFSLTQANIASVARIVRRLDGIPLALELAAARLRTFDPHRLAGLLDDRFRVLVSSLRTAPARHQTLRAAVAWSYDLLPGAEQALFRRLSIFEGGFALDAAQRVFDPDAPDSDTAVALLPSLVERSLVVVDRAADRGTRYRLLETLREYGRAQLDADESRQAHLRHLAYFIDLADEAADGLRGPQQGQWLDRMAIERDNLQAALRWSLTHGERASGLRLAAALAAYWDERASYSEGAAWLREALAGSAGISPELRAFALAGSAQIAIGQGEHDQAVSFAEESLAILRETSDERAIVRATTLLGMAALYQARYAEAAEYFAESRTVYERLGLMWELATVLGRLGQMARQLGDFDTARSHFEEALAVRLRIGDLAGRAWSQWQLGVLARYRGDYDEADALYRESIDVFDAIDDAPGVAHVRYSMGDVARLRGDYSVAVDLYTKSLAELREYGDRRCVASTLSNLGKVALHRDDIGDASGYFAQSLAARLDLGDQAGIAECLEAFAAVAQGADPAAAARLLGAADALREATGASRPSSDEDAVTTRVVALRAELGAATFDAHWAEGRETYRDGELAAVAALVPALSVELIGQRVSNQPASGNG